MATWDLQGYYGTPPAGSGSRAKARDDSANPSRISNSKRSIPARLRSFSTFGGAAAPGGAKYNAGVMGVQGLAPYLYEVDAALFVSHRGGVTARVEAELDQRITQRLILQPRADLNLAAQNISSLGIGRYRQG